MLRKFLLLSCIIVSVVSCQKEFNIEDVDPPVNPPVNDSSLLKTYIERDTTLAPTKDTVTSLSYSYDAQKRMTTMRSRFEYDHTDGTPGVDIQIKFQYNGNDTLPYRVIAESNIDDGFDQYRHLDTAFFFYNAAGQRIKDSITRMVVADNDYSVYVSQYTYTAGKVILSTRTTYISGPSAPGFEVVSDTFHTNIVNGNLLAQTDTLYDGSGDYSIEKITLAYDNKPNPFLIAQKMLNMSPVFKFEMWGWEIMQKNNPLQISNEYHNTDGSIDRYGLRFAYQYKANNYPASVIVNYYDAGSGTETFLCKAVYTYMQ